MPLSNNCNCNRQIRHSRNFNQRNQRQNQYGGRRRPGEIFIQIADRLRSQQRRRRRLIRRDTLIRIVNLPPQISSDPIIDQFFNGGPF